MSLFKKACAVIATLAVASSSFVATTALATGTASNPTVYLDYSIDGEYLVVDVKAKDLPTSFEQSGVVAPYAVQMGEILVNIDDGATNNGVAQYTLPTVTNDAQRKAAAWLKNNFYPSGWAAPVNWNGGFSGTSDNSKTYLVIQKSYGSDALESFGTLDENGGITLSQFKLKLVDPTKVDTTITIGRADVVLWNLYDDSWTLVGGESQLAYSTTNNNLNVEPLTIKVGGNEGGDDEPTVVYNGYVGDDDAEDVAIGAYYEFTAPEAGAKGVKWTVEPNEGDAKTHVSAVDVAGGATYKLGLIIQGLAKSAVKSITAALQ